MKEPRPSLAPLPAARIARPEAGKVRSSGGTGPPITGAAGRPAVPAVPRAIGDATRCHPFRRERPESPAVQPAVPGQARTAFRE
jgi:hypothetical protein